MLSLISHSEWWLASSGSLSGLQSSEEGERRLQPKWRLRKYPYWWWRVPTVNVLRKPPALWGCWLMWARGESFYPVPPDPGAAVACAEEADPRKMWVGWKLFLLSSSILFMSTHSSSGCQRGEPGVSASSMTPFEDGPLSAPKGWEEVSSPYWHLPATQCLTSLGSK